MTKINPDLLTEQEWACTLYPPDMPDLSFVGQLKHSPTTGLTLQFATTLDDRYRADYTHLHGHTSTGIAVTLVGNFSTKRSGYNMRSGSAYQTSSGHPFHYVIFGRHFDNETIFHEFHFDIAGADEFFARTGSIALVPFGKKPLFSASAGPYEFTGRFVGSFHAMPPNLSDYIVSDNDDAMNQLQAAYNAILQQHEGFWPMIKKTARFSFSMSADKGVDVITAHKSCHAVADLFSILFFDPARLSRLIAVAKDEEGMPHEFEVFPWRLSEAGSLARAAEKRSHLFLPLNNHDVDLGKLLSNWMDASEKFSTTISMIQGSTALISESEILSKIVLNVAQLEGMAHEAKKHKLHKYQHGIDAHSSPPLSQFLKGLLGREVSELGEAISDLRNDIAHMGRPRTYLDKMSFRQKYNVCLALEAIVMGYILDQIGASKESITKYQKTLISIAQR